MCRVAIRQVPCSQEACAVWLYGRCSPVSDGGCAPSWGWWGIWACGWRCPGNEGRVEGGEWRGDARSRCCRCVARIGRGARYFFTRLPPRSVSRCAEGLRASPPRPLYRAHRQSPTARRRHLPSPLARPENTTLPARVLIQSPTVSNDPRRGERPTLRGSVQRRSIPRRSAMRGKTVFVVSQKKK